MRLSKLIIILGSLIITSCASTPDVPTLTPDAQKVSFTHTQETFRRGLKTVKSSSVSNRPNAIIEAIYSIDCLSVSNPSAEANFAQAQSILKEAYVEAPLYFNNPRERGYWRNNATRKIFDKTSCVVKELKYGKTITDKTQVMLWALTNGVGPK